VHTPWCGVPIYYTHIHAIHEIWITDPVGISGFLQSFYKRLKGLLAVLRNGRRDCINSIVFVGGMWGREGGRKDSRLSKVENKETQTYIHVILHKIYITFFFTVGTKYLQNVVTIVMSPMQKQ